MSKINYAYIHANLGCLVDALSLSMKPKPTALEIEQTARFGENHPELDGLGFEALLHVYRNRNKGNTVADVAKVLANRRSLGNFSTLHIIALKKLLNQKANFVKKTEKEEKAKKKDAAERRHNRLVYDPNDYMAPPLSMDEIVANIRKKQKRG